MIRVVFHTCGILHDTLRIRIPIAQRSLHSRPPSLQIWQKSALFLLLIIQLSTCQISHVNDIFFHFTIMISRGDIILHSTTEKFG